MAEIMYPANINLFTPPAVTDGFSELDAKVAAKFEHGAIRVALALAQYSTLEVYTRSITGSDDLTLFYQGVSQSMRHFAPDMRTDEPTPLAIVKSNGLMVMGQVHEGSQPSDGYGPAQLEAELAKGSLAYLLRATIGLLPNGTVFEDNEDGMAQATIVCKPGQHYSSVQQQIESTSWVPKDDVVSINRVCQFAAIAVGHEAVELLPQLQGSEWGNAYDQLVNRAVAKS